MEGVSVEDAGSYQCMIGRVENGIFTKDTRLISVEVATETDLQFGEDVDTSEEAIEMLKDQVKDSYSLLVNTDKLFTFPGDNI